MGDKTGIEWTDATWNPLAGCTPVSEGCRNCYAATMAYRLAAMGQEKYKGTVKIASDGRKVFNGHINLAPEVLEQPLRWKKPRRIFVNSMSDPFHAAVPDSYIERVFQAMTQAHWHTFQVLTKRPERMRQLMTAWGQPPANIWLGTSVENQAAADERIPHLLATPAVVRFLSCEPLLGPVELTPWLWEEAGPGWAGRNPSPDLSWVIVGGESGPKARPMHPDWARGLRDQAQAAGVAFHFKQHGEWASWPDAVPFNEKTQCYQFPGTDTPHLPVYRVGKHAAGRILDGLTWDEFPE